MRINRKLILAWIVACSFVASIALVSAGQPVATEDRIKNYYLEQLDSLKNEITEWQTQLSRLSCEETKQHFRNARHYYKKIEFIITYHFPATAQRLNGANLPEAEISQPQEPRDATGFQVIEEIIFGEEQPDKNLIRDKLSEIEFALHKLNSSADDLFPDKSNILDAIKLNLYRLITHGITGFDSPVALNSLQETESSLQGLEEVLVFFPGTKELNTTAKTAKNYVQAHKHSFDSFDRALFITSYIHPLTKQLTAYQNARNIPYSSSPPRAINPRAATLFDKDAIDEKFYKPAYAPIADEKLIALGKKLFHDKMLSVHQNRSCATCHIPSKAFTDGLPKNQSLFSDKTLLRNTPTLLNAGLQPVQFYDSRVPFLEDQVHAVISSPEEMGTYFSEVIKRVENNSDYQKAFKRNFKTKKITEKNIKIAIAAYVRSLNALNSPFDRYMRGEEHAINADAIAGFNLFMGKAKCGTCHFMPMFNGSVPPLYHKMESEVLGVPERNEINAPLDSDLGKGSLYGISHQMWQFKTTSVRNVALTAPYMHNGIFQTLEEVIDFYDAGGGVGRGLIIENQTLPPDSLHLTATEKKQLILFMEMLTDTVVVTNTKNQATF